MCGIAGAIDLTGSREPDNLVVRHMDAKELEFDEGRGNYVVRTVR